MPPFCLFFSECTSFALTLKEKFPRQETWFHSLKSGNSYCKCCRICRKKNMLYLLLTASDSRIVPECASRLW